jgi:hypothetical protein
LRGRRGEVLRGRRGLGWWVLRWLWVRLAPSPTHADDGAIVMNGAPGVVVRPKREWRKEERERANTGVLRCAQDDGVKRATATTTAEANAKGEPGGSPFALRRG